MAEGWNARPVSGEIMTARAASAEPRSYSELDADIVDAQFEAIAPGARVHDHAPPRRRETAAPPQGMDVLRRAGPKLERPSYSGTFFLLGVATLATVAFWISGGHVLLSAESFSAAFPR